MCSVFQCPLFNHITYQHSFYFSDGPIFPKDECDPCNDFVPLPDFDKSDNNDYALDAADPFWDERQMDSDCSEMVPDDRPFYTNQEEDPAVITLQYKENFGLECINISQFINA